MYKERLEFEKIEDGLRYYYRMTVDREDPMSITSEWTSPVFDGVRLSTRQFIDISELEDQRRTMIDSLKGDGYTPTEWSEDAPNSIYEFNRDVEELRRAESARA